MVTMNRWLFKSLLFFNSSLMCSPSIAPESLRKLRDLHGKPSLSGFTQTNGDAVLDIIEDLDGFFLHAGNQDHRGVAGKRRRAAGDFERASRSLDLPRS
jgi:hypothetical protein